jgi:hypothetical protein
MNIAPCPDRTLKDLITDILVNAEQAGNDNGY